MRILIIGSGGREHALALKLKQSSAVDKIFIAPGNGGTDRIGNNLNNLSAADIPGLVDFALKERIDLVVPGPELPLTLGITEAMQKAGIACFGPDSYCAKMEGSKSFAKEIMHAAGVPTAQSYIFTDFEEAKKFLGQTHSGIVIKADGLAAGKGVIVTDSKKEALDACEEMLTKERFGEAGKTILIEEKLVGEEVSLLCFCDGEIAAPLPSAQDHKAVFDNDKGPNTGGMGAYSPAPCLPDEDLEKMTDLVIRPVLKELAKRGHPYKGILYAGLMLTKDGGPKVLEYNVRFGDPECQPLLMRMESDLASHMLACVNGTLTKEKISFNPDSALGVVLTAKNYPDAYEKDLPITGIDAAENNPNVTVFHSGTYEDKAGVHSCGGRVLCITATGKDLMQARENAYGALNKIRMPKSHFRTDIGLKGLNHQNKMNKRI